MSRSMGFRFESESILWTTKDGMAPDSPMIQSRTRHVAKDSAYANEYDDAYCVDEGLGRVAIADGVGTAIFSGRWARILTKLLVENPPDLQSPESWGKWLAAPRQKWLEDIDFPRLPANQKTKLRQTGGSFCTLCWGTIQKTGDAEDGSSRWTFKAYALGDSCLLHIRNGELLKSFPLATAAEFDSDPNSVCSVASSRDTQQKILTIEFECVSGDVIVMVTDAIGKWMLECLESNVPAPWEHLWSLDENEWMEAIAYLRNTNVMKRDDTTMIVLQVGVDVPIWLKSELHMDPSCEVTCNDASSQTEAEEADAVPSVEASLESEKQDDELFVEFAEATSECAALCSDTVIEDVAIAEESSTPANAIESDAPVETKRLVMDSESGLD